MNTSTKPRRPTAFELSDRDVLLAELCEVRDELFRRAYHGGGDAAIPVKLLPRVKAALRAAGIAPAYATTSLVGYHLAVDAIDHLTQENVSHEPHSE